MTTLANQDANQLHLCSLVSRENGEDAIGSAVSFERALVLEVPLPWPRNVWDASTVPDGLNDILNQATETGPKLRAQAIQPDHEYSRPGHTYIFFFDRPESDVAHYRKQAFLVPDDQVVAVVEALLLHPEGLHMFEGYRQAEDNIREILVCTHSTRDACCAKFGRPVYEHARQVYAARSGQPTRVWQTSHLGGHRFAGTLLDMPRGHYWGWLTPQIMEHVLDQSRPFIELAGHYRGWSGLSQAAQIAERAIIKQEGWSWLGYHRRESYRRPGKDQNQTEVQITFSSPDHNDTGQYNVIIEEAGHAMSLPSSSYEPVLKKAPLYTVRSLIKHTQ